MSRTTLNIDDPVLRQLKQIQKKEGKPLGQVASELLVEALARRRDTRRRAAELHWTAKPLKARVELEDKEAVFSALDRGDRRR